MMAMQQPRQQKHQKSKNKKTTINQH